jgi:hypothetical protein
MTRREKLCLTFPHLDKPGCCPSCGLSLCLRTDAVLAGGSWSKRGELGSCVTAGHLFECRCPGCDLPLLSFPDGWPQWQEMDPAQVLWYPRDLEEANR